MKRRPVKVEVRPTIDPDGKRAVLLQLEDGYLIVSPQGAFLIAAQLIDTANEIIAQDN